MVGLLLNDLYSMKRSVKTYVAFLAFFAVVGIVSGNVSFFGPFVTIYSMMFGISVFSYHEACNWDAYANTLPITRGQMVWALYQVAGLAFLVGSVLGFLLNLAAVFTGEMQLMESLLITGILVAVGALMMAVDIPLLLQFGSERARLIMMGSYVVLFLGFWGVSELAGAQFAAFFANDQNIWLLAGGLLAAALAALLISYRVTLEIYRKKEF